jgi:1-acyl-sn-glycerol-3-phosphate acyltransferase
MLISLWIWSFFGITIVPLFFIFLISWVILFPVDPRRIVSHYFIIIWARIYLSINPWWKVTVENRKAIDLSRPVIFVSNHQSILDTALLLQLNIPFRWVCKVELVRIPVIGWIIRMNKHIVVRRGDKQSVLRMADACKKSLDGGISVFMFPEGTRTGNGHMGPFKEGAFILARDTGYDIVPVILDGASEALPKKSFVFSDRKHFTVRILEKIPFSLIRELDLEQLIAFTRTRMEDGLRQLHPIDNAQSPPVIS